MSIATIRFSAVLWGFARLMQYQARRHQAFREPSCASATSSPRSRRATRRSGAGSRFATAGRVRSGAGLHAKPDITLAFKDAALGAALLTPPINWLDQINAQKDFKLTVDGPEDLTNWWAQTMMAMLTAGWKIRHQARRRHHALLQHDQWRPGLRLCQGRQDRPHDADRFRRQRSAALDHRGARPQAHAAAPHHARAARPERQIDRLFARPAAPSDEARRFRSQRRAQSAEPRQVGLCAHFLGRGARHRRHPRSSGSRAPTAPA